jgi:parvulin-like peptidyl-prolyl isomerase
MLKRLMRACSLMLAAVVVPLQAQDVVEQVLVKVNGDIVTKSEFEARQVAALRGRPELANLDETSDELRRAVSQVTPRLILDAVDELLLVQRGRELGYALGDEQFKQILGNIRKQNNLEDEERFQAALKQEGMTLADLRRNLERQMLVSRVQQVDIADKISVTDDELKAYYEENKGRFTTAAEITLREILVNRPTSAAGINVALDDEARARAEAIRARAVAGEPFALLAAETSDAPSKANGGLIGPISRDELASPLQTLLDGMQVGDVTEVLSTARGYQVLKLEARTDTKIRSFEDARDDIGNALGDQKMQGERVRYLDRLRAQATITWRNEELKRAYEQALAARQQAAGL